MSLASLPARPQARPHARFSGPAARLRRKLPFLFLGLLLLYTFRPSSLSGWDDSFYWAQLTSLWHDGDLLLHDDLLATWDYPQVQYTRMTTVTDRGALHNLFSIGPAFVQGIWTGPVVAGAALTGEPRLNRLVLASAAAGALWLLWLAVHAVPHLLRGCSLPQKVRWPVTFAVIFGTPLIHYAVRAFSMSHLLSAVSATFFVALALHWLKKPGLWAAVAMGMAAGTMVITRWQDVLNGLFLLPPIALVAADLIRRRQKPAFHVSGLTWSFLAAFLVLAVQMIAWKKQFNFWVGMPHSPEYMQWAKPQIFPFLFSGYHGLFTWSPVVLPAIAGLVLGALRRRGMPRMVFAGALLAVTAQIYVNSCPGDWWGGASYGARRICSQLPFLLLGLGQLFAWMPRWGRWGFTGAVLLFAQFTLAAHDAKVDDLAIPVLNRSSVDAPLRDHPGVEPDAVIDGPRARQRIATRLLPQPKPAQLVKSRHNTSLWRVLTVVAVAGTGWAAWRLFLALMHSRRARKKAIVAYGGWTLTWIVLLVVGVPSNAPEDEAWKRFLASREGGSIKPPAGRLEVAADFLLAADHARRGEIAAADQLLKKHAGRFFPRGLSGKDLRNLKE